MIVSSPPSPGVVLRGDAVQFPSMPGAGRTGASAAGGTPACVGTTCGGAGAVITTLGAWVVVSGEAVIGGLAEAADVGEPALPVVPHPLIVAAPKVSRGSEIHQTMRRLVKLGPNFNGYALVLCRAPPAP